MNKKFVQFCESWYFGWKDICQDALVMIIMFGGISIAAILSVLIVAWMIHHPWAFAVLIGLFILSWPASYLVVKLAKK